MWLRVERLETRPRPYHLLTVFSGTMVSLLAPLVSTSVKWEELWHRLRKI